MAPRWLFWVFSTVALPVVPWLTPIVEKDDATLFMVTTGLAVVCQLVASIILGIGIARKRAFRLGGTIGMSVLFTVISWAVATGVYLLGMMIFIMMLYEKKGV
ncbi:hypothetical protein DES53_101153 [Roseimicrobium gellanilyticum]|uniref:Uncharacterized protein n=1 Tax=Roseimicrobium gellanilyticum TaxID=748857 RepID=A0A366HSV3_9BACT|nr:hypothetical protein [Roseimicrobium gellanilyticum]RBP47356.1 hypothetical protein DES53_101153 [Roseimicrobium gellanilyticum]